MIYVNQKKNLNFLRNFLLIFYLVFVFAYIKCLTVVRERLISNCSSHWGSIPIFVLKFNFAQSKYLNFHAKNIQFKLLKSMKYLNFRAKNQIENSGSLVLWVQKFKCSTYLNQTKNDTLPDCVLSFFT